MHNGEKRTWAVFTLAADSLVLSECSRHGPLTKKEAEEHARVINEIEGGMRQKVLKYLAADLSAWRPPLPTGVILMICDQD